MNTVNNSGAAGTMATENGRTQVPSDDRARRGNNGEGSVTPLLEAAAGLCRRELQEFEAWRETVDFALSAIAETGTTNFQALSRLEAELAELNRVTVALSHNLEQIRLQTDGLSRSFEKLSQEVIQRQVMDPFFVACARLYEAVYALSDRASIGDGDVQPILSRIRGFLEDH